MVPGTTCEWREREGIQWLEWACDGVTAAFPTRVGGVSRPPYDSLDLGLSVGDTATHVLENRRRLCVALGLDSDRLVVPGQTHGTRLGWVGPDDAGRGARESRSVIRDHDGLLCATGGLGLAISYADCVPVVIVAAGDPAPSFATVHAGWRGMLAGIVGKAAVELARRGRLLAAVVGPSIGPCCFTVDDEICGRFETRFPRCSAAGDGATGSDVKPGGDASRSCGGGASVVDLWECARADLVTAGVPREAITVTGVCTASDPRFFSHRRDRGATGRHLALAWRQEG